MPKTSSKCAKCLSPCLVVNQYVIEEYQKVLPQLPPEDVIHARLKSGWFVGQPKQHYQELEMSKVAFERCLLFVVLFDANLMIS
jgi:hypothetical protein